MKVIFDVGEPYNRGVLTVTFAARDGEFVTVAHDAFDLSFCDELQRHVGETPDTFTIDVGG